MNTAPNDTVTARANEIFAEEQTRIWKNTDRLFAYLLMAEWVGAIIEALVLSPRAWVGSQSQTHVHVWASIVLGGVITIFPVILAFTQPGRTLTRHSIALAQMLMSALLIHLSGGRIETHFHIFASLAFLAFYRDWRVFITASLVVALDHALRGAFWPRSVYGTPFVEPFRWVEHTAWVVFEDLFLIVLTFRNQREMRSNALREASNATLERMRDEAVEATNLKSRFIANVSHELRTPLAGMLGMSELLLEGDLNDDQRGGIEAIQVSARSLAVIVNDLLDLSRIEANKLPLEYKVFNPLQLIRECVQLMIPTAEKQNISLVVNTEARLPQYLVGDPVRIHQVLQNLLGNAVKFTDGGTITIGAKIDSETDDSVTVRFDVSDTGIGLTEDELQYLFLPFTQVDGSTTRRYAGSGLGLAICKGLMQLMQGEIAVMSKKGLGSTFWFKLPLRRATEVPLPEPEAGNAPLRMELGAGENWILVVEDNPVIRQVACKQVERLGFNVRSVASGQGALEELARRQYNLIMMDCHLPDIDGFEATRRIRAAEIASGKGTHIPILAVTASAMDQDRERCAQCGMDDYLSKPYTIAGLREKLASLLKTSLHIRH